ncbi:MAG: hypothetical protein KJ874_08790 [Acidobacteria bacterium]|nr:hypothetical protein [Acidobacteriota bacterium]
MEQTKKRIHAILGDDNRRTMHNATRYREYLLKHLSLPIIATGTEDFPWEEPYVFGGWDKRAYQKLKKTNPSYTDTFELQALGPPNEHEDIAAKTKRVSDGKVFEIGLSWLSCKDEESETHALLDDFGIWYTNY